MSNDKATKNGCRPAYPNELYKNKAMNGLTKREYFAAMAMQGLCANNIPGSHRNLSMEAVAHADALLAALEAGDE